MLGRVSVRLVLNDWLARYGGHVGYGVLPQHRRKGVATALLREALSILHAHDVEQALVVCDDDNEASKSVPSISAPYNGDCCFTIVLQNSLSLSIQSVCFSEFLFAFSKKLFKLIAFLSKAVTW